MEKLQWGHKEGLRALLLELVGWDSLTGTEGEKRFAHLLKEKLKNLEYYKTNPEHLQLVGAGKGRFSLTALYQTNQTAKTIVLISHYDTVHVEEYGELRDLAFQPEKLTEFFRERKAEFSEEVQQDIDSENYLFGRGTMDMKMGLALHMQ